MGKYGVINFSKKKISMWLLLVILTIPHMNPPYLEIFPLWETFLNGWRLVSFAIIVFWLWMVKKRVSAIVFFISAYEGFLLLTTVYHQGEVYHSIASAFSALSIVLLYDVVHNEGNVFLSSQLFCFEIVIYTNLITELLYPNGLYSEKNILFVHYKNWFLGYYNNHTKYFIPAMMFAWLFWEQTRKCLRVIMLTLAMILSAFLVGSGGVYVSLFIMLIVYVFLKNMTRVLNYFTYWLLQVVFFLAIYIFRFQELFRWLIDSILEKWNSLIMRIYIWEQTADLVSKSPIWGYGVQNQFRRAAEVHRNHGVHAHNLLLVNLA